MPPASDLWVMHSGDHGNEKTRVPPASDLWVMHSGDHGNEKTQVPPASKLWVIRSADRGNEKRAQRIGRNRAPRQNLFRHRAVVPSTD